jgi:hypothetical protein
LISSGLPVVKGFPLPDVETIGTSSRRLRLATKVVQNAASGVYTVVTTRVRWRNPSSRLNFSATFGWLPDRADPRSNPLVGAWTATLTAFDYVAMDAGQAVPTNGIIPGPFLLPTALPWTYETQTLVPWLESVVTVPNAPGTGTPPGVLWAVGTWEPESATIVSDEELASIFGKCAVECDAIIQSSNTGA